MRIALQQPGCHDDVHERVAVAGNKSVAGGIKALAELADPSEWFIDEGLRMKPAVLPLGNDRLALGVQRAGYVGIREAAGDVHPAIGPERGAGDTELFAAALGAEPGQDNLPHIRASIAGAVLQIPNIRRARQEDTALPRQDGKARESWQSPHCRAVWNRRWVWQRIITQISSYPIGHHH